jgi:hypothetical protein
MTITLDIRPEVEAELARQAAAQGRGLEASAARLLEEAAHLPAATPEAQAANLVELCESVRGLLTDDEIDRLFTRKPSTGRPGDFS